MSADKIGSLMFVASTAPLFAMPFGIAFVMGSSHSLALMTWPFWLGVVSAPGVVYALVRLYKAELEAGNVGRAVEVPRAARHVVVKASIILAFAASIGGVWMSRWLVFFFPGSVAGAVATVLLFRRLFSQRRRIGDASLER